MLGLSGWVIYLSQKISGHSDFKKCSDQYPFISSELDCGNINEKIEQVEGIDDTIENFINQEEQAGNAKKVSVFFRDLNTRRWFGVNENVNFYPASLAKLPIAMMTYKSAEINKKILEAELPITEEDATLNTGQHYEVFQPLEAGKSYPVREQVRKMLTYSDNAPVNPLMNASVLFRDAIFYDLGVFYPPSNGEKSGQWNISAKSYANLFRVLYNASYLRPEYSNEILKFLSESTFNNALPAGTAYGTKVAHKYGETAYADEEIGETLTILNDCGIIYKKDAPYVLCVMTQGQKFEELERIIQHISETVYNSL